MNTYIYFSEDIIDKNEARRIRQAYLHEHLNFVKNNINSYAVAGPNKNPQKEMIGSTFIIKAGSLTTADKLMQHDPYVKAGLYQTVKGHQFSPAAGSWVGGITWE